MSHPIRPAALSLPLIALFALLGVTGCAHAEFDILQPPDLAQHVGTKEWVTAPRPSVDYRMIAYEDHLVIHAYNHTGQNLILLAEQSTVVDPAGQSHPLPLRNQTILPNSFAKLILPPVRPQLVPTGPAINIGFGATYGSAYPYHYHGGRYYYGYGYGYSPYWYEPPRYYVVYGGDDSSLYWPWPDGGQVRLVLTYVRPDAPPPQPGDSVPITSPSTAPAAPPPAGRPPEPITHEFVFRMKKV
jgi:hypothetical protein